MFQKGVRLHLSPYVGTGKAEIELPLVRFELTTLNSGDFWPDFFPSLDSPKASELMIYF